MELDRTHTCCFSGHRPDKLPSGYRDQLPKATAVKIALSAAIDEAVADGYDTFLCGMAQGADWWAAEEILRRKHAGVPLRLIAALPCPEQDSRWPQPQRAYYRRLLLHIPAEDRHLICDCYTPYCMNGRNLWMVEHASRLIAVFDGTSGGTANTVRHAEDHRLTIIKLHPQTGERW